MVNNFCTQLFWCCCLFVKSQGIYERDLSLLYLICYLGNRIMGRKTNWTSFFPLEDKTEDNMGLVFYNNYIKLFITQRQLEWKINYNYYWIDKGNKIPKLSMILPKVLNLFSRIPSACIIKETKKVLNLTKLRRRMQG